MKNKIWIIIGTIILFVVGGYLLIQSLNPTGDIISNNSAKVVLKVAIPCSGHAQLIINELQNINGVEKNRLFTNKYIQCIL